MEGLHWQEDVMHYGAFGEDGNNAQEHAAAQLTGKNKVVSDPTAHR